MDSYWRILTRPLAAIGLFIELIGIVLQLPDDYLRGNVNINVNSEND